jgi:intracellular septation protein A
MAAPAPARLLLLQLVPLLVFLAVDTLVKNPAWAIVAALAAVAFQAAWTFARERRFDRLVLLDVALIGGLGAVSLVSRNDLFFKLKPAILEAVMVPYLAVLAFGGERLLGAYLRRYSTATTIPPAALGLMRRLLLLMTALVAVHAAVTVWAALYASRAAWAAISGPGFYVILVPVAAWVLWIRLRARRAAAAATPAAPPGSAAARGTPRSPRGRGSATR